MARDPLEGWVEGVVVLCELLGQLILTILSFLVDLICELVSEE